MSETKIYLQFGMMRIDETQQSKMTEAVSKWDLGVGGGGENYGLCQK